MANILVIDDNDHVRNVLIRLLESQGHSVQAVSDSHSGIGLLHVHPFDLLITDILLPDQEGITTIIEILKSKPDMKIIAISGGGDFEPYGYLDIARRVGAARTLPKPFSMEEMIEAVNDVLGRPDVKPEKSSE